MARLLREYIGLEYDKQQIIEAKMANKPIAVKALLQRADEENQNHRVYKKNILEREVENYKKAVLERRAMGELDHPEHSVVELKSVSHIITDIWWDGNEVRGIVEILDTPSGKIAKSLMESGVKLGISSRGVGEVKTNEGKDYVQDDFCLICFDLVSEPSTIGAWLNENKQVGEDYVKQYLTKNDRIFRMCNEILKKKSIVV